MGHKLNCIEDRHDITSSDEVCIGYLDVYKYTNGKSLCEVEIHDENDCEAFEKVAQSADIQFENKGLRYKVSLDKKTTADNILKTIELNNMGYCSDMSVHHYEVTFDVGHENFCEADHKVDGKGNTISFCIRPRSNGYCDAATMALDDFKINTVDGEKNIQYTVRGNGLDREIWLMCKYLPENFDVKLVLAHLAKVNPKLIKFD